MMFNLFFVLLLAMAAPSLAQGPVAVPDPKLTPGETNPALTQEVICDPSFRTEKYRAVSLSTKKRVFDEYGIPWADRPFFEVDHLVSLELGGSNAITNLWPEPFDPFPGAHEKDTVENYLHRQVCAGHMDLETAQEEISDDWYSIYQKIKGENK